MQNVRQKQEWVLSPGALLLLSLCVQLVHGASGYRPSTAQSTAQKSAETQNSADLTTLELGVPVERELAAGQKHAYQMALTEGQYARVEIKQLGAEVRVLLQQPDGKTIPVHEMYVRAAAFAFERVAESSGIYRLDVYARAKAATGRYEIRIAELHPATQNEHALNHARTMFEEFMTLQRASRYIEARPLVIRALEIREGVLGPDDLEVGETLGYLAGNYALTGDYLSAEPLYQRALKIKEKALGPKHPMVANALREFGDFYYELGDYFKAEELFQKALDIFDKAHLADSITISSTLDYLGHIYYSWTEYEKAGSYYQRSLAMLERLLGPDHFHLAFSCTSIGRVAYDAGDYTKAEAMYARALALTEKAFGPDHIQLIPSLNDLGLLYSTTGDYAKAEALYRRALLIHERAGLNDPNVQTLFGLARLYAALGRSSEAVKAQARASEVEERFVGLNLAVGSEREKLALLDNLAWRSSRSISFHTRLAPDDAAARDLAVTTILRRKGRVQDAMSQNLATLRMRFGPEDRQLLDQLNDVTSKLAHLVLNGPQQMTPAQHQQKIKTMEDQREELEAEISGRSAGFYERSKPVTISVVQAAIPPAAALVEFAVYRPFDPKAPDNQKAYGEPRYVAYVLRSQGNAQWKELGEARAIDASVDELRQALRDPQRNDAQRLARDVDEKVMQPVRALTGDATQLLISPDGELNLIPFAALVDEQGRYLIHRFSFTYLTSGRDLLRMQVARDPKSRPLLVANPSFGEPATELLATRGRPPVANSRHLSVTTGRDLREVYFAPLGGTAQEARSIQSLFPDANVLSAAQATESAVKQINAPRLLHLATHGFFLSESRVDRDPRPTKPAGVVGTAGAVTQGSTSAHGTIDNPLLRSGLALANANLRNTGNDDGILTALEASGLNLWGTKLVVLSACDTGVGEVRNGEGVYGLRRAFVLAGAESLVMSLWPASDYTTRELMTNYYKNLKQGAGRGEALRAVQLDMLKRNPKLHPFYWANFIQSGEWASLDGRR